MILPKYCHSSTLSHPKLPPGDDPNREGLQPWILSTKLSYHLKSTCTLTLKRFPTLDNAQNYHQPIPDLTLLLLLKCLLFTEYWLRFAPSEHLNHARCDDCPPLFTSLKTRNCSIFTAERGGGRGLTNSKRPILDRQRGCSRLGVHGTTGVGVGLGAGEGREAASLTPPPPSVNRRLTYANGVMHSRVDISWDPSAEGVLGVCLNMLFFLVYTRGSHYSLSWTSAEILYCYKDLPIWINLTGSRSLEEMAEQLFLLTTQLSGP